MATIRGLYNRVSTFDASKAAENAMNATSGDLITINKEQMNAGYNRFDEKIGDSQPYKSADYAFDKYRQNPLPGLGNPDLNLTGSFQSLLSAVIGSGIVSIKSADPKNDELLKKYPDIMGLGGPYKAQYLIDFLRPAFAQQVYLGIGIKPR